MNMFRGHIYKNQMYIIINLLGKRLTSLERKQTQHCFLCLDNSFNSLALFWSFLSKRACPGDICYLNNDTCWYFGLEIMLLFWQYIPSMLKSFKSNIKQIHSNYDVMNKTMSRWHFFLLILSCFNIYINISFNLWMSNWYHL